MKIFEALSSNCSLSAFCAWAVCKHGSQGRGVKNLVFFVLNLVSQGKMAASVSGLDRWVWKGEGHAVSRHFRHRGWLGFPHMLEKRFRALHISLFLWSYQWHHKCCLIWSPPPPIFRIHFGAVQRMASYQKLLLHLWNICFFLLRVSPNVLGIQLLLKMFHSPRPCDWTFTTCSC